jgi:tetratricopeptide (TPR) repeat protein
VKPNLRSPILLLASGALLLPLALWANERDNSAGTQAWNKITDGKIELYTPDDPQAATGFLLTVKYLTAFLKQAGPFTFSDPPQLVVVAFHSETEFSKYRLNAGSCAFYQQTEKGEYVVLQDLLPEHRSVSAHEFTHFLAAHSGLKLPLWLHEGIADVYSTLSVSGDQVTAGEAVPGRMKILHHQSWLPLPNLFSVGTGSDYYSQPVKMEIFYSESWLLTHMLALSPAYAPNFRAFLRSISEGRPAAESLQLNFHKSVGDVEADLRAYSAQSHLPEVSVALRVPPLTAERFEVSTARSSDVDVALSDLVLANPNSKAEIQTRLATAASRFPEDAKAEGALGYMAMHQGRLAEAREHFHKAIDRHSTDATVYFYAAHYDREAGIPDEQVVPLLQQALEYNPANYEAHLELAMAATGSHNYALALEALSQLGTPRPEHAYAIAYSLAYCYAQTDKLDDARATIAKAKLLASNDQERAEIRSLLAFVEQQQ